MGVCLIVSSLTASLILFTGANHSRSNNSGLIQQVELLEQAIKKEQGRTGELEKQLGIANASIAGLQRIVSTNKIELGNGRAAITFDESGGINRLKMSVAKGQNGSQMELIWHLTKDGHYAGLKMLETGDPQPRARFQLMRQTAGMTDIAIR